MFRNKKIMPLTLLLLGLLVNLALTACNATTAASPFKSFKEVDLAASIKQAMLYYNTVTRTPNLQSAKILQSVVEKYYTSDEPDLEKLANELDTTLTGQGYVFDTTGSPNLKASGATKPVKISDY